MVCLFGSSLRISSSGCTDFHFASCLVPLPLSCMIALAVALATVQFWFLSFLTISFVVTWLKALGTSRKKNDQSGRKVLQIALKWALSVKNCIYFCSENYTQATPNSLKKDSKKRSFASAFQDKGAATNHRKSFCFEFISKSDCEGFLLKIFCSFRLLIIILLSSLSSSSSYHHHHHHHHHLINIIIIIIIILSILSSSSSLSLSSYHHHHYLSPLSLSCFCFLLYFNAMQ